MKGTKLAPKVKATYQAVIELFMEGADLNNLTVAEITGKAGIGKGTAYEYFSNKEEMIAGALYYDMKNACRSLYRRIGQEKDLYGKMDLLFDSMEKKLAETNCFMRAVHVMLDNSAISSKLKEMVKAKEDEDILIQDMISRIVEDETEGQAELTAEGKSYLVMEILSKMICFAMCRFGVETGFDLDSKAMRDMLCRSICREVDEFRVGKYKRSV